MPLLYLAWFGAVTFFGNLMSAPFVGDFSDLAAAFELPMSARYAAAVIGLLSVCALSFLMGTELHRFAPAGTDSGRAMLGMIVLPVIVGTALGLFIFLPFPPGWIPARLGESAFWLFAAAGTFVTKKPPVAEPKDLGLRWPDLVILLAAALVVRWMASGIDLLTI